MGYILMELEFVVNYRCILKNLSNLLKYLKEP
jgi:hypothetical protein